MAPFARKRMLAPHAGGRPTDYRPEYCEMVIEALASGVSLTAFAGMIRVSKDTVYEWMVRHSEFSDAVARGKPARLLHLERKLLAARYGAQCSAAIFALRNADPTEWRDIRSVQHDHNVRVETLTDQQLFAIASGKALSDANTIEGECTELPHTDER
jgi:hypothetical protein